MRKIVAFAHLVALTLVVSAAGSQVAAAAEKSRKETQSAPSGAPFVTATSQDALFQDPYIDVEEWRDEITSRTAGFGPQLVNAPPVKLRHLYVHGGFKGTDLKFAFVFPPKQQYGGRFYHYTYPTIRIEDPSGSHAAMAFAYGAAIIGTNMGGVAITNDALVAIDATIIGYRANAAAAKYAKVVAQRIYGPHRMYGYIYGASGRGMQSLASAENTEGVWDGSVPLVFPNSAGVPITLTARAHAIRVLKDKWPQVIDAFEPGGGNPYAGLTEEERNALEEATRYGFPPRAWFNYLPAGGGALHIVEAQMHVKDPSYESDFWSKPGYLGTDPSSSVRKARVQHAATIARVIEGPPRQIELSSLPSADWDGADVIVASGPRKGQRAPLVPVKGNTVRFGFSATPAIVNALQAGDEVTIDNSRYLSLQTYHRHQIPALGTDYDDPMYAYFRKPDGITPIYPQRPMIAPATTIGSVGVMYGDKPFHGKMIAVHNLLDGDALPWQADWYRRNQEKLLGSKYLEDNYRVWIFDNAQHVAAVASKRAATHVVSYQGMIERALYDLSMWVEKGVVPAANTAYTVTEGQVHLPAAAQDRKGVQPTVILKVNGEVRADVKVGETVNFTAKIEVPLGTGRIAAADWDFEGTGDYAAPASLSNPKAESVDLTSQHVFSKAGTYFPALRATSHRQDEADSAFGRVQNLGRVRVVVR